jgi:hypothetical protein
LSTASHIKASLDDGDILIINLYKEAHWALAYGYDGDTIFVEDSATEQPSYQMSYIINRKFFHQLD